jgi:hypothetical protein
VKIIRVKEIHFFNFESQFQNRDFSGLGKLSQPFLATEAELSVAYRLRFLAL